MATHVMRNPSPHFDERRKTGGNTLFSRKMEKLRMFVFFSPLKKGI